MLAWLQAFDTAEKELGIAPFMTGEELVNRDTLDKAKMVGYLSQFYDLFRKQSAEKESGTQVFLFCMCPMQNVTLS